MFELLALAGFVLGVVSLILNGHAYRTCCIAGQWMMELQNRIEQLEKGDEDEP